jgi:diacylglycerol kinase (ATP)
MLKAFRHIVHAAGFSMAGLGRLMRNEIAARIELVIVAIAFIWFFALRRPLFDHLILLILACVLFSVEALNTAIEEVVDEISPERSAFGKAAKDLGSTAVFFALAAGAIYIVAVTADAFGLITL